MKIGTYKIDVEATVVLTQRELQLLHHLMSYNNKPEWVRLVAGMESSSYHGGVSPDEMVEFMEHVGTVTKQTMLKIEATAKALKL